MAAKKQFERQPLELPMLVRTTSPCTGVAAIGSAAQGNVAVLSPNTLDDAVCGRPDAWTRTMLARHPAGRLKKRKPPPRWCRTDTLF